MINGALCLESSRIQISPGGHSNGITVSADYLSYLPTLSRTCDNTDDIIASNVCSWLHPGLFSSFPFFARVIKSRQSEYAFCTRDSFFSERIGPGMTSFIPKEKPMFAISNVSNRDLSNGILEQTKPTGTDFGEPVHSCSGLVGTIIAHYDTKN